MAKKKEKLDIELLALQVRRLANEMDGVGAKLRGIALTEGEFKVLLGELRAVRYLLDSKKEFAHLDRVPSTDPRDLPRYTMCPVCKSGLPVGQGMVACPGCRSVVPT